MMCFYNFLWILGFFQYMQLLLSKCVFGNGVVDNMILAYDLWYRICKTRCKRCK